MGKKSSLVILPEKPLAHKKSAFLQHQHKSAQMKKMQQKLAQFEMMLSNWSWLKQTGGEIAEVVVTYEVLSLSQWGMGVFRTLFYSRDHKNHI